MPSPTAQMDDAAPHGSMTFREHLIELRQRLMRAALAVIVGFFVAWQFHVELYALISAPVREALANHNLFAIKAMAVTESIEVYMKLALGGGLFVASPVVFWQLWAFVAPGLLDKEKRLMLPVLLGSVACFFLGAAFCYLAVLPFMTDFLVELTVAAPGLSLEPTLASTISFSLLMLLAFGAVFELPLFMYLLAALQLVTAQGLLKFWRYWVVIAFIIGAVLTPTPDPINQTLMSAPLVLLYGVGVGLAWLTQRTPGERLQRRTAVLLAATLTVLAAGGVALSLRQVERSGLDALPAAARSITAVHAQQLPTLTSFASGKEQVAHAAAAARTLAPLRALQTLRPALHEPMVYVVDTDAGAVVVAEVDDAEKVVQLAAKSARVSATESPAGLTAVMAADATAAPRRLRLVAAGKRLLWLGDDAATAALSRVVADRSLAAGQDEALAGAMDALRGEGAVWALAPSASGLTAWLPGGALRDSVRFASALLNGDGKSLRLRFVCKGPEAAQALRERLESWAADHRAQPALPAGTQALSEQVAGLAAAVAAVAEAQARQLPPGSPEAQRLRDTAREVLQTRRQLQEQLRLGPSASAGSAAAPDALLTAVVQASTAMRFEVRLAEVDWTLEAPQGALLALLGAPGAAAPTGLGGLAAALQSAAAVQKQPVLPAANVPPSNTAAEVPAVVAPEARGIPTPAAPTPTVVP